MIAINTKRIALGPSVINPYTVHPAVAAASTATLDEISGGRACHGIAAGGSSVLEPLCIKRWHRPVATLRDALMIIRRLFDGEKFSYKGQTLALKRAHLAFKPPHRIPLYLATRGPQLLQLAGELADGVNLGASPVQFIPTAIEYLKKGLAKSQRNIENFDVHNPINFSLAEDADIAFATLLKIPALQHNFIVQVSDCNPLVLAKAGIKQSDADYVAQTFQNEGLEAASKLLTPDMIKPFSVFGTPEDCIHQLKEYRQRGVTNVGIFQPLGPDPEWAIKTTAKEIIPALKE
jgi:5,10-methylenetetrahydromethanopterin reductase